MRGGRALGRRPAEPLDYFFVPAAHAACDDLVELLMLQHDWATQRGTKPIGRKFKLHRVGNSFARIERLERTLVKPSFGMDFFQAMRGVPDLGLQGLHRGRRQWPVGVPFQEL